MNITAPMVFKHYQDAMEIAENLPTKREKEEIKVLSCKHGFVLHDGKIAFTYERLVLRGVPLLKLMTYSGDI